MKVLVAARKSPSNPAQAEAQDAIQLPKMEEGRVPFDDVLQQATVIVLSLLRNPEMLDLISAAEFKGCILTQS